MLRVNVTFAGTIGSGNPQNDPTIGLAAFGGGALTKLGTGTLTLAPAPLASLPAGTPGFNNYIGGTNILNGTLSVASDLALGADQRRHPDGTGVGHRRKRDRGGGGHAALHRHHHDGPDVRDGRRNDRC